MAETTGISWTDATFNPWWGCTRVSPGCENCYAETFDRRVGGDHWGPGKPRRVFGDKHWNEPLKWDEKALRAGRRTRVFCASMADIFDADAPEIERLRLWNLIRSTPNLDWQLLTKRVDGYKDYLPADLLDNPRVWKGFTAEDQRRYDERWDFMRRMPGFTWWSYEPALMEVTMYKILAKPQWVVFGGESGAHRRSCDKAWAEKNQAECKEYGIPWFMKQMSARTPAEGKLLIPEFLNIQEFPVEAGD
jgi:protein gp37